MNKRQIISFAIALLMCTGLLAQDNIFSRAWRDLNAYFNTYYNAKVYFKNAQELYDAEEDKDKLSANTRNALNKAAKQAQVVMDKFPRSSFVDDVMFYNSVCQFQLGMYELALESLENLTLQYPGSRYYFEAKLWISKCYFEMNKKTIAYDLLEQFLENSSNRAYFSDAYSLMGNLALQEEDSSRALNAFLLAAENASEKGMRCNMYLEAVSILLDKQEYEKALNYTDRARRNIRFDEQRANVQLAYIRAYRQQEKYDTATKYVDDALKDARIATYWGDVIYEQANIFFDLGKEKSAVSKLRTIVEDPENTYRNNQDSQAWTRAAFRLGKYYTLEKSDLDSAKHFFQRAHTKRRQSPEGQEASDFMLKLDEILKIKNNLKQLEDSAPHLSDSAWVRYEMLKDSVMTEKTEREGLLADTLYADSSVTDSLIHIAETDYHQFESELSQYMELTGDYTGNLFNLAGVFLFDLAKPDTALHIYQQISREFYYYTPAVPKALYSQAYVWEYEFDKTAVADSIKENITKNFPDSEISDYVLNRVPRDSLLYYQNQEKIYEIEREYIDRDDFEGAVKAYKALMRNAPVDDKSDALIAYKIAWLYDHELSLHHDTKDSTLHYYHLVEKKYPGTPLARRSARRIAAIETHIREYLAYLEGDSLEVAKTDSVLPEDIIDMESVDDEELTPHPIRRRLESPGRPRPERL